MPRERIGRERESRDEWSDCICANAAERCLLGSPTITSGSMRREEHVLKAAAPRCGLFDGAKQRVGSVLHQPAA